MTNFDFEGLLQQKLVASGECLSPIRNINTEATDSSTNDEELRERDLTIAKLRKMNEQMEQQILKV